MIDKTFDLFYQDGHCLEVRGLLKSSGSNAAWEGWAKGTVVGYFDNRERFVEAVANLNAVGLKAIYVCPNPAPADMLAVANNRFVAAETGVLLSDNKVAHRNWLIVDVDPQRLPGISSSDDEMELASSVARGVMSWLYEKFMVDAYAICSGNGVHVLIPVSMPNTDENTALCKNFAQYIKAIFEETGITIDAETANISRNTKVLGTWARKGDNIDKRPHRRASLIKEGSREHLLTAEQMAEYKIEKPSLNDNTEDDGEADQDYWSAHRLLGEYLGKAANGNRNKTGLELACALRDQRFTQDVARDMLTRYQAAVPGDGYGLSEALASVDQAYSKEPRSPRKAPKKRQAVEEEDFDGPVPTVEEIREALGISAATVEEDEEDRDVPATVRYNFPYLGTQDNTTVFLVRSKNGLKMFKVANFVCWIEKEILEEDGTKFFLIKGQTKSGGKISLEIDSEVMGSERRLAAILEGAAGAMDGIAAGMQKHISSAIKALTQSVEYTKRFSRVGWWNNRFLMPGREQDIEGVEKIVSKMPYRIFLNGSDGTDALRYLIEALPATKTTVALSFLLAAPLANVVGWRNKRCALFIQGRFNSLKTAWASTAMSIYGDFANNDNLLRWGEGSTTVALSAHAIMAADVPLLVDNFKPQTGKGSVGFVNFIHAVLEGGEKERGDGKGHLRDTRPIYAWPFFTGESLPDDDAATITRCVVLEFKPQESGLNVRLSRAQQDAHSLPAIGYRWITWLESDEGRKVALEVAEQLPDERNRWASRIMDAGSTVNALRVAQNLALLSLTWKIALQCPVLGDALSHYTEEFLMGLSEASGLLAQATGESQESEKFLRVISELVATGRVKLIHTKDAGPSIMDGDRMIGWYDNEGIYLLPRLSIAAVERVLGWGGLNKISERTLYNQLESMGIVAPSKGATTKTKKLGDKVRRILHLNPDALAMYGANNTVEEELPI